MNRNFYSLLRHAAILGDGIFILGVAFNAIDESFKGTIYQKISYIGLVSLLILNISLLSRKK